MTFRFLKLLRPFTGPFGRRGRIAGLLPAAVFALGCGEGDASGNEASGGSGGSAAASSSTAGMAASTGGGAGADEETCANDVPEGDSSCLELVTGQLIDEAGDPLADLQTSVCGPVCYSGEADASGRFEVEVGRNVVLSQYSFLPHGRPKYASFYFPLPREGGPEIDIGQRRVLKLPETGDELIVRSDKAGAPKQDVTSGPVTLHVAEGVSVRLDVEDLLAGELGKQFRVLPIPEPFIEELTGDASLLAVYALSPFEAFFEVAESGEDAAALLSFDNSELGLEGGTKLDVLALGSYLYPDWVTPAAFEVVAAAAVTEDGSRIELAEGEELPYLTWVALRVR